MGHIFISHAEENADVALRIARGLEAAGYATWYYERDGLPGLSHVVHAAREIEASEAVVLLISPDSLESNHVTMEVVWAFESARPFIPLLIGISHGELSARQPEWRVVLGSTTSVTVPVEGVEPILPRILDGLRGLGITPSERDESRPPYIYTLPPPQSPQERPPAASRRNVLVGLAIVALIAGGIAVASGGGGGDGTQSSSGTTLAVGAVSSIATPSIPSIPPHTGRREFPSADDTPVATSAGSLRVTGTSLTTESCPPSEIPGDCLTAAGTDRYLVLHLTPAAGGRAAMTQVFANQAHQSSLSFGGGLEAGAFRVALDESANRIEIVYGIISASAAEGDVLLHWPGNEPLLVSIG